MKRTASARWNGDLKQGKGTLTTQSGTLSNTPYAFTMRFGEEKGTNPEELIGAAHAGCFTMALSGALSSAGHVPEQLDTKATVTLELVDGNQTITSSHLECTGRVPGIDKATFDAIAEKIRAGCIVSRALTAKISLSTVLL